MAPQCQEFLPKNESLPRKCATTMANRQRWRFGSAWAKANIVLIDKTTEVAPGVTLIAQISDAPGKGLRSCHYDQHTRVPC